MSVFQNRDGAWLDSIEGQSDPVLDKKIISVELDNVAYQELEFDQTHNWLDIAVQGDGVYAYFVVREGPQLSPMEKQTIEIHRFRTDEMFHMRGLSYVRTVVVENRAYHFFSNYTPSFR